MLYCFFLLLIVFDLLLFVEVFFFCFCLVVVCVLKKLIMFIYLKNGKCKILNKICDIKILRFE